MHPSGDSDLQVTDLGRLAYADAFAVQRELHARIVTREAPPTLLLVEHEPVITISRRRNASRHLIADARALQRLGIDVQPTDRGGDITYHGPGQLVAYPIVRLSALGLNVGRYMRLLEQVVIDTLASFDVKGQRVKGATGVWVDSAGDRVEVNEGGTREAASGMAKIAALGVRVSRNVSLHGLALNVTTDLSHFDTIVPCGLADRAVTSLRQLLGERSPAMERVKAAVVDAARRRLRVCVTIDPSSAPSP